MKVRCLESFDYKEYPLVEGQVYQVDNVVTAGGRTYFYLKGQPPTVCWSDFRFEIIKEEIHG